MEVRESLLELISEHMGVSKNEILPDTKLADLGGDSLDALELAFEIEEEFDIYIPDEDIEKNDTFEKWIEYVEARKAI